MDKVLGFTSMSGEMISSSGLTDVQGLAVGHCTLAKGPTGCTVILARDGAVAGVDVRGGAPGTRETDLLDPVNSVDCVHAVVLSGGSAFGLDAASGVVQFLEQQNIGFSVGPATVPIVVGAILFDLAVGDPKVRPDRDSGRRAAAAATTAPVAQGSVGAGAGATVGKLRGFECAMKGGLGTSSVRLPNGLVVAALVAVNAVGDVVDPAVDRVVAGSRVDADGHELVDCRRLLRRGDLMSTTPTSMSNTTIGVVATNADLSKSQVTKVAQMAHDGFARTIFPAHTPWDGDTVFALATRQEGAPGDVMTIGALAAETMAQAILNAVRSAGTSLPGVPSVGDL